MDNHMINDRELPPVVEITESNRSEIEEIIKSQKLTIVHGWYKADESTSINLSKTTYLWDQEFNFRSRLIFSDGMPIDPKELGLGCLEAVSFTLYFEPLPPECKSFWLWEETDKPYAFSSIDIKRNDEDVYRVVIEDAPF
jgi:hypothetical protein